MSIVDPSVLDLLNHAESRYTLVVEASKRGREIVNGALPMIDANGMKPLKTAVEEINRGLLTYDKPAEQEEQNRYGSDRQGNRAGSDGRHRGV